MLSSCRVSVYDKTFEPEFTSSRKRLKMANWSVHSHHRHSTVKTWLPSQTFRMMLHFALVCLTYASFSICTFAIEPMPNSIGYSLALRRVELPPGEGNPVDRLLTGYFQQHSFKPPPSVDDRRFVRRVSLDLQGLLPTCDRLQSFLSDNGHNKREQLVHRLLSDRDACVQHRMTFWSDRLRVGSDVDGGVFDNDQSRAPVSLLRASLEDHVRYDSFVRNLITGPYLDAYSQSIAPDGEVSSPVRGPEMQHATIMTQVFLGVQLKCASCHDSFIDHWKLADAWGMASALGNQRFEIFRCQQSTGKLAEPQFLFPELGTIDPAADKSTRRQQVAELMTTPRNGLFARTIVNRLWARLFGRGLIEPLDEMLVHSAWHPELLEWLSGELVRNDFKLDKILKLLVTSNAYSMPADSAVATDNFVFQGPKVRRLTAEQFVDALYMLASPAGNGDRSTQPAQRAWTQENDRLMNVLGRPSRDAVVTVRETNSFPLQALELTNGRVINQLLNNVSKKVLESHPSVNPRELADRVYRQLLSRTPTPEEQGIAVDVLGEHPNSHSVSDFIWITIMLPEFQFIY